MKSQTDSFFRGGLFSQEVMFHTPYYMGLETGCSTKEAIDSSFLRSL